MAIVYGEMHDDEGVIKLPLGRHPSDRKKMSTHSRKPREALTVWRVLERYNEFSLLLIRIKTGRTHQIRVHLSAINHPIVGDPVYGVRAANHRIKRMKQKGSMIKRIPRQMLHAFRLELTHPHTKKIMCFEAPIPVDMQTLITKLKN